MIITGIATHLIDTPVPTERRVESGAGLKLARQMCLIEISTDEGLFGYGSPSGPYDLGVLARIITDVVAPHLIGADPLDAEFLWHRLYHGEISRNLGHRGIGIAVLSGIDIALWDLKGKAAGQPIYQLLGGRYHRNGVRSYASSIYWDQSPAEAAEQALTYTELGFSAVKLKIGRNVAADVANVAAIRSAIGDDSELLVDANQSLSRTDALYLLGVLEEHRCYWFEEPISVDDLSGHVMLRSARTRVRIASGENMYTRFSFADFVLAGGLDVLQADVSRAGGITEVHRISQMAACLGVDWNPHTFNDIVTVVANLHLVAASPHPAMFEWDVTHNDLMTHLAEIEFVPKEGSLTPPAAPGLGLEFDWEFIKSHRWDGAASIGLGHGMRQ